METGDADDVFIRCVLATRPWARLVAVTIVPVNGTPAGAVPATGTRTRISVQRAAPGVQWPVAEVRGVRKESRRVKTVSGFSRMGWCPAPGTSSNRAWGNAAA
ncbi:hypothetical protein KAURM247S_05910 [Kitasatospora aureofaciens]